MTWFNGAVLYLLVWWITLFAVLPIGTQPIAEANPEDGGWRGAPRAPQLGRKAIITTAVAAVIWGILYGVIVSDLLSFRTGWLAMPEN
jgi:predicted secreted protein